MQKEEGGEQRKGKRKMNLVRSPLQLEILSPMIAMYCHLFRQPDNHFPGVYL